MTQSLISTNTLEAIEILGPSRSRRGIVSTASQTPFQKAIYSVKTWLCLNRLLGATSASLSNEQGAENQYGYRNEFFCINSLEAARGLGLRHAKLG